MNQLGLGREDLLRHIAWDIGAAGLARRLADRLGAELILQVYSRLVVDCNRDPASPDIAPEVSDGSAIPGNAGLAEDRLRRRLEEIHAPYHAAIAAALDRAGAGATLVSIHSFTPVMRGFVRPWEVGVLHEHDSAASDRMLAALRLQGDLTVGDNEPYAMDGLDYTIPRHAKGRGLDYLELEVRQDLVTEDAGQALMASRLAPLIADCAQPG